MSQYRYKWKYEKEDRPFGRCYDCRMDYRDFQDFIIEDSLWEQINPTMQVGAGILCPTCIVNRLNFLGLWYNERGE